VAALARHALVASGLVGDDEGRHPAIRARDSEKSQRISLPSDAAVALLRIADVDAGGPQHARVARQVVGLQAVVDEPPPFCSGAHQRWSSRGS